MLLGGRLAVLVAGLIALLAVFGAPLAAQDHPNTNAPADSQMAGAVHMADGTAIPGATLRVIQTSTGKAWVTWTDENGQFKFPALPSGHYRVEISQLGFAPASREIDLASGVQTPVDLKMDVGTLAAITAPPATGSPAKTPSVTPSATTAGTAASEASTAATNQTTSAANSGATSSPSGRSAGNGGARGARGGNGQQGGPGGTSQGGGRRAFQPVGLNGQNQNPAESASEDQNIPEPGGQLGQAASADAVQMIGTVAMGQSPMGGFPQPGDGGPDTRSGFGNGDNAIPGQALPGGVGGSGGQDGGGFGGGPRGGFGGRGGGGGRGPQGGPAGIDALWGAQRVMRQRINRIHYSFYDTFGDSALNARPYSLYEANPPKISSWTESAGINIGGPLKIPHVYDSSDKTFFYINFGGTWSRSPVDQFATVPTQAERNGDFSADNVQIYNPLSNLTGPRTLMTNAGCYQATPSSPLPATGTCIPTSMISSQAISLLNYIPLPNISATNVAGQNFNYHLQTNLPGLSNRLNVNITHRISAKLSLQVNYNLSNGTAHSLSEFPGIEGNTFTRGQSAMIGLTQNWTKTFAHTSQFYFSRNRSLGLNEFSNGTDIGLALGLSGISSASIDYGLPSINFTNFTGLSDPNFSLNRNQTYRYVDSLRWMKAKHTIAAGGEIRKMDINRDSDPAPNGQFSFTGLMTPIASRPRPRDRASETISRIFCSAIRQTQKCNTAIRPRTSVTGVLSATRATTGTCSRVSHSRTARATRHLRRLRKSKAASRISP